MKMTPLHPRFGVTVTDVDLRDATADHLFPEIRSAFEEHSLLFFPKQEMSDAEHIEFAKLFGPIEDRNADERPKGKAFEVPQVSNLRADGSVTDKMDMHTLHLQSNMLWHADSTFMPNPALTNILIGRIVTETGGATEFASTRAGWEDMPDGMKSRIRGRAIWHKYSHSRARISEELAKHPMFHKWPPQKWNAVWRNPVNKKDALYVASHAYAVEGYDSGDGAKVIDDLIAFCTQPDYVYAHQWQEGDVLIWDQRAVLHRGTPWDYDQPRKLSSICISATAKDGLDSLHPPSTSSSGSS